eukprot:1184812-Rhodomonas_salina.1
MCPYQATTSLLDNGMRQFKTFSNTQRAVDPGAPKTFASESSSRSGWGYAVRGYPVLYYPDTGLKVLFRRLPPR